MRSFKNSVSIIGHCSLSCYHESMGGHRCLILQLISREASYLRAELRVLFSNSHTRVHLVMTARSANGISGSQSAAALSSLTADDDREDDSHRLVFLSASLKSSERHPTTKQHRADLNFHFFPILYVAVFRGEPSEHLQQCRITRHSRRRPEL